MVRAVIILIVSATLLLVATGSAAFLEVGPGWIQAFDVATPPPPPAPSVPQACIDVIGPHYEVVYLTDSDDVYPPPGQAKSNGSQVIFGLGGNDQITAGNAKDCLIGGDGNDVLVGGNGKDYIDGGADTDTCSGDNGKDVIVNCEGAGSAGSPLSAAAPRVLNGTVDATPTPGLIENNTAPGSKAEASPPASPADASSPTPAGSTPMPSTQPSTTAVACQPLTLTYTGATSKDGNTTYSYTLIGGGAAASGCKDVSSIVLPVCFNPDLAEEGGSVISESHPSTPAGWGYEPQGSESTSLATWTAIGPFVGSGPFDAVFSLTLKATVIPLVPTVATVSLVGSNTPIVAGTVVVPAPEGCTIAPVTAATPTPDPVRSGNGNGSFVTGPNATSNDAPPRRTPSPSTVGNADY